MAHSICMLASEATPFAKTGGLADVAGALTKQLHATGHDVRLVLPLYVQVDRAAHGVTPVEPLTPGEPAYRDVLVVTFVKRV